MPGNDALSPIAETVRRRGEVVAALREGSRHKRDLVDALDVSRSTVTRALRDLQEAGLAERDGEGYALTAAGRLAHDEYRAHERRVEAIAAAAPLLDVLPTLPDPDALVGSEVHLAEPPAPHQPLDVAKRMLTTADRYRGLSRAVTDPAFADVIERATVDGDVTVEFVYAAAMADHLREQFPATLRRTVTEGDHRAYVAPSVPFGLGIATGTTPRVCLVAYEPDDARLRGVLVSDADAAVEWAEGVYESYRARATELELPPP